MISINLSTLWVRKRWVFKVRKVSCIYPRKKNFTWQWKNKTTILKIYLWLVVEPTHLKNISQIGSFPRVGMNVKNTWNHQVDNDLKIYIYIYFLLNMECHGILTTKSRPFFQTWHLIPLESLAHRIRGIFTVYLPTWKCHKKQPFMDRQIYRFCSMDPTVDGSEIPRPQLVFSPDFWTINSWICTYVYNIFTYIYHAKSTNHVGIIYPWILWVGWIFSHPHPSSIYRSRAPYNVLRLGGLSLCIVEVCWHCNHSLAHVTWSSGKAEIFTSGWWWWVGGKIMECTRGRIDLGVSLNGGTPKTPQNDYF